MDNPPAVLSAPPPIGDPQATLEFLKGVAQSFAAAEHPRVKPLQKRLSEAIDHLSRSLQAQERPQEIAARFVTDVRDLYVQTYELISVLVNQFRASLRVKLLAGMPAPDKINVELLQQALSDYAQAVRKMIAAQKKGDATGIRTATEQMARASELVKKASAA